MWILAKRPRGFRLRMTYMALLAALGALLALALAAPTAAQAASGNGLRTTTFYAYAVPGERVDVSFGNAASANVYAPDQTLAFSCTGAGCAFTGSSTVEGVWVVEFVNQTDNLTAWRVAVLDSTDAEIQGRVWAESMTFSNTGFSSRTFWAGYLSEFGVQYRSDFIGHVGWVFRLSASNRGIMFNDGSCLSAYRSVPEAGAVETGVGSIPTISGDDYTLDGGCGSAGLIHYRVFYQSLPDPAMPTSTANWGDGRTTDTWVLPTYVAPSIVDVAFTRGASGAGGVITGQLLGQPGTLRALIDLDGDGTPGGARDRSIEIASGIGGFSITWDGLDGLGAPYPRSEPFTVLVELAGEAEIHFVESDVEGRTGGIQVTRINGPAGGNTEVSWDDSHLPAARATVTSALTGARVDTAGGGVHAWAFNGNGWGNGRLIDDWMFAYPSANAALSVAGEPELASTGVDASDALAGVVVSITAGVALIALRQRMRIRTAR